MQRTLSERKILKMLGISDFRQMTKDKVVAFASMLPRMNPEVAKKALEQFPEYVKLASNMVDAYKGIIDKMLEANAADVQVFYDACNSILASLDKQLENENLSSEERVAINDRMIIVANMIGDKVSENKRFWMEILGNAGKWMLGLAIAVGSAIGISLLTKNDSDS